MRGEKVDDLNDLAMIDDLNDLAMIDGLNDLASFTVFSTCLQQHLLQSFLLLLTLMQSFPTLLNCKIQVKSERFLEFVCAFLLNSLVSPSFLFSFMANLMDIWTTCGYPSNPKHNPEVDKGVHHCSAKGF